MHHAARVLLILLLNHSAATFDAWSTRELLTRYPGSHEANPIERPFASSGAVYLTGQVDAAVADFLVLRKSSNRKLKIAGGVFEGVTALGHLYSGMHNVNLSSDLASGLDAATLSSSAAVAAPRWDGDCSFSSRTLCEGPRPVLRAHHVPTP